MSYAISKQHLVITNGEMPMENPLERPIARPCQWEITNAEMPMGNPKKNSVCNSLAVATSYSPNAALSKGTVRINDTHAHK